MANKTDTEQSGNESTNETNNTTTQTPEAPDVDKDSERSKGALSSDTEVTKESVNYGFDLQREDYQRTLANGEVLNVQRAVLTYKDEINIYEIATLGAKDSGILVMTMAMDDNQFSQGRKIIELFWSTLQYKSP